MADSGTEKLSLFNSFTDTILLPSTSTQKMLSVVSNGINFIFSSTSLVHGGKYTMLITSKLTLKNMLVFQMNGM